MIASRSHSALATRRLPDWFRHPSLESLEGRLLMAGLDVPQLSSRPGAAATIYLDFDGHTQASWGSFSNIVSPAYSRDADLTTFSASDLTGINDIWTRVAEDFAPFNVNVTTVEPPSFADGVALRVVIGGKTTDWYGSTPSGGAAFLNSFTNTDPNVVYVFSGSLSSGFPKFVSEAASRQVGTALGLHPQAKWSGSVLQEQYSTGSGEWAPVMGNGNFAQRSTWYNGATDVSPTSFQDDMAIIGGATNGFGFVADDYADTLATATNLPLSGSSVNLSGLIGSNSDQDVFKFTTAGGNLSFNLAVARVGANLDSVLELRDANGQVVTIANDATSGVYTSALTANVASGTYYLVIRSSGGYGNVGQYTLTGTVVPGVVTAPEISVLLGGTELASGANVSFGPTVAGTPVSQTFTVQNFGNGDLTLTPLNGSAFPAGFSLVTNVGSTTLVPGASTTFTVQLDAAAAGSYSGTIHVLSNDADEGSFDIALHGFVVAPEIRVFAGSIELASGGSADFGTTAVGAPVTQTFTVQNAGDGNLDVTPVDPASLPAGFTLVNTFGPTTVVPGSSITFTVRFDAAAAGVFGGAIHVLNSDLDEGSFNITLGGHATSPEISITGSPELTSGDTFDFGTTVVGAPVTHTFVIHNLGDGSLTVSTLDGGAFPAGFTLVSNVGVNTLAPGDTTTFTVQFDALAAGSFGGAIHVLSNDNDEGSFDIVLRGLVTKPEVSVSVSAAELASGGTVEFGTTQTGASVTRTITVKNVGDATLTLTPIDASTLPPGFTLVTNLGATTLAPGQSTTFTVRLNATAAGSYSGVIHVLSNDADEHSFDLTLRGTVNTPPPPPPPPPAPSTFVKTIDNGAHGFKTTGKWHVQKHKNGYDRDIQFANKAEKRDKHAATATWTFKGLEAGQYRITVSAPKGREYASNAPFSVFDGSTSLGTVLVNQRMSPVGRRDRDDDSSDRNKDVLWQDLGTFTIQGGMLVVQLTNRANAKVVADAVRIELVVPASEPLLMSQPDSTSTANASSPDGSVVAVGPEVSPPPAPPEQQPAPASEPLQLNDITTELALLEQTSGMLDELAADLAQQNALTTA